MSSPSGAIDAVTSVSFLDLLLFHQTSSSFPLSAACLSSLVPQKTIIFQLFSGSPRFSVPFKTFSVVFCDTSLSKLRLSRLCGLPAQSYTATKQKQTEIPTESSLLLINKLFYFSYTNNSLLNDFAGTENIYVSRWSMYRSYLETVSYIFFGRENRKNPKSMGMKQPQKGCKSIVWICLHSLENSVHPMYLTCITAPDWTLWTETFAQYINKYL